MILYYILLSFVIGWVFIFIISFPRILAFILCLKKKNCKNDECPLRNFCGRIAYSDKELAEIEKQLSELD